MAKYRHNLPQLSGEKFLTDGGLETTLLFHEGIDLPCFAAFDLLRTKEGREKLKDYYRRYARIAAERKVGFILDSPTWRASADWGDKLGYSAEALKAINEDAIALMLELRSEFETPDLKLIVSGNVGPRGDGYNPANFMSAEAAEAYHAAQVNTFAGSEADMVTVLTMTYPEEAVGIARAARAANMPCAISFTLETDGRLPSGHSLGDAIEMVDAKTGSAPIYYMINCAHPTHFADVLDPGAAWAGRIRGLRANASRKSHAELDKSETLDEGDPAELGGQYRDLLAHLKNFSVFGGCCGTDHRHVTAICEACMPRAAA